jgi:orotate phosphoribosyltransferase
MEAYQEKFIAFALTSGVLRFGRFVLKSGRESPYFFNSGLFSTGQSLARLGRYYAAAVSASGIAFDMLYGAAYKGIPLVAATATALWENNQRDVPYCFNRKEAKDHGEKGEIVGASLAGRVLIVDDVISAGTSIRESVMTIRSAQAKAVAVTIALDRQERGQGQTSALRDVEHEFGLRVISIVTLDDVVTYLQDQPGTGETVTSIELYRDRYGIR